MHESAGESRNAPEMPGRNADAGRHETGKTGILDMRLDTDGGGRTIISGQYSRVPLQVQRAIYPDESLPHMAYVYVLSPSGGILQGDRYHTDIALANGAAAHVTTQGATRIYGMDSGMASQITRITVGRGCYLEYIPDQIIPYGGSTYHQDVSLNVHDDSAMVYSEILTPGRVAMGETFEFDLCHTRTRCTNQDGRMRFIENARMEPGLRKPGRFGMLGGYQVSGTVYVMTAADVSHEMKRMIDSRLDGMGGMVAGTSVMPYDSGVTVRILGSRTDRVSEAIRGTVDAVRTALLDAGFAGVRKS